MSEDTTREAPRKGPSCPICGRPAEAAYRPFCSTRCADADLHRWLTDAYAIPVAEEDGLPDDEPDGEARNLARH